MELATEEQITLARIAKDAMAIVAPQLDGTQVAILLVASPTGSAWIAENVERYRIPAILREMADKLEAQLAPVC
jgi:D-alanyl-D-alanine carboxypeptidase